MVRLLFAFVLLPVLGLAQVRLVSVRDWDVPGIHHARVNGRVVNAHGMAIAGAAVRLFTPPFASIALYETRTGSHGDFEFPDVSYDGDLEGAVDPPAEWLPARFEITGPGGVFQAGDIRLKPSAALRVVVEMAPGQVFRGDPKELRLLIRPDENESRDWVTSYADGVFTVDRLPYGRAKLEVDYKDASYTARLVLDSGSRSRVLVARIPTGPNKNCKLEIVELTRPWEAPAMQTVEGTVRTADGSPVDGAEVTIRSSVDRADHGPTQTVITDADGRYRAEVARGTTFAIQIEGTEENHASGTDLQTGSAFSVEAVVEAPDGRLAAQARVRWSGPMGWRPLGRGRTWIVPVGTSAGTSVQFVAELPGYFPLFSSIELPESPAAPAPVVERFRFTKAPVRTLEVRAAGKPLAGAAVEIVRIGDPSEMEPVLPVSYRTGPDGNLRLAGEAEGRFGVLVYARGYGTGRALWRPGVPLTIDLTPESAVLEVDGLTRGTKLRVSQDGGGEAVAAMVADQRPPLATVAPANYDLLVFNEAGRVASVAHAAAIAGRTTRVSFGKSRGAEIRVTVADADHAWIVAATPVWGGPDDGAEANTNRGVAVLQVGVAGRYRVRVTRADAGQWWMDREVEVTEGSTVALSIPPLTASLTGSHPGTGEENGELLILEAAAPTGWNAGLGIIKTGQEQHIDFQGLPAGKYYAWSPALDAETPRTWNGVPVTLEAGRTLEWKDPPLDPGPPLKIRIAGADGRPVPYALLYVNLPPWRERIFLAQEWPLPQALVPVRNGTAYLAGAGPGRLLLELLSERGRIYSLTADVGPGRTLEIRLPKEEQ